MFKLTIDAFKFIPQISQKVGRYLLIQHLMLPIWGDTFISQEKKNRNHMKTEFCLNKEPEEKETLLDCLNFPQTSQFWAPYLSHYLEPHLSCKCATIFLIEGCKGHKIFYLYYPTE